MPDRVTGIQGSGWTDAVVPADESLPPETSPSTPEGHCDDTLGYCSTEPITAPDRGVRPPVANRLFTPNPALARSREGYAESLPPDLPRYESAERKRNEVLENLRAMYPEMSRLALQLDFSARNPEVAPYLPTAGTLTGAQLLSPYEPSIETLKNLPIVRTYEALRRSANPADRAIASHMGEVLEDLRHGGLPPPPSDDGEAVDEAIARLERLYADPRVEQFIARVRETERRNLERDEGYTTRRNLSAGLTRLRRLANGLATIETFELDAASPEQMEELRQGLLQQAEVQTRLLEEEIRKAHTQDESQRPQVLQDFSDGSFYLPDPNWIAPRELEARRQLVATERETAEILQIDCSKLESVYLLAGHAQSILSAEESSSRRLLGRMIDQVGQIPGGNSSRREARELRASLERIDGEMGSVSDRIAAYLNLTTNIDQTAFKQTLEARIQSYREMTGAVRMTDRAFAAASSLSGMGPLPDRAPDFREVARRYEAIREMAQAGHVEEAREAFVRLEQAQVGTQLQGVYEAAETVNTYGIGVGIVIASAATGGVLSSLVGPAAVDALGATAGTGLVHLTNAAAFTVTDRLLLAGAAGDPTLIYNPGLSVMENAGSWGAEIANNAGMFAVFRGAGRFSRGLGITGALATEVGAFTAWDFLSSSARSALQGGFDPAGAADQTLGTAAAWRNRILYLFSLKVGAALASPITVPMHEAAREIALGQYRDQIARLDWAISHHLEGLRQREGADPLGLLSGLRRDLERRQAIVGRIAPELRDPQSYAASRQLTAEVRNLEAAARSFQRLFGSRNRFGAEITGPDSGRVPARRAESFVRALRSSPHVSGVTRDPNGVIAFDIQGPLDAQSATIRFYPTDTVVNTIPHDAVETEAVRAPAALPAGREVPHPIEVNETPSVAPRVRPTRPSQRPRPEAPGGMPAVQQLTLGAAILLAPGAIDAAVELANRLGSTDGTARGVTAATVASGLGLLMALSRRRGRGGRTPTIPEPVVIPSEPQSGDWVPPGPFAVDRDRHPFRINPWTAGHRGPAATIQSIGLGEELVLLRVNLLETPDSTARRVTLLLNRRRAVELGILQEDGQAGTTRALSVEEFTPPDPPAEIPLIIPGAAPVTLRLVTGSEALHQEASSAGIAGVTDRGRGHGKNENEDRLSIVRQADGLTRVFVFDGVGGDPGGERAAEIGRATAVATGESGIPIEGQILLAHEAIAADTAERQREGSAVNGSTVVLAYEVTPNGNGNFLVRFARVGDAEAVGIRLTGNPAAPFEIPFTDGRLTPETVRAARFDPNARFTEGAIGDPRMRPNLRPSSPVEARDGDILLSGSDGFFENFGSYEEIAWIIARSGERTPEGIRRVLMQEATIRMRLFEMMAETGTVMELTHERYVRAYTDVTGTPPPPGWRGTYEGYVITLEGYVGRPENLNRVTEEFNRDQSGLPLAETRFKGDNATLVVQVLGDLPATPPVPPAPASPPSAGGASPLAPLIASAGLATFFAPGAAEAAVQWAHQLGSMDGTVAGVAAAASLAAIAGVWRLPGLDGLLRFLGLSRHAPQGVEVGERPQGTHTPVGPPSREVSGEAILRSPHVARSLRLDTERLEETYLPLFDRIFSGEPELARYRALLNDPVQIGRIRGEIRHRLGGNYMNMNEILRVMDGVLKDSQFMVGTPIERLGIRGLVLQSGEAVREMNIDEGRHAWRVYTTLSDLLDTLELQFFPDDVPLYRVTSSTHAGLPTRAEGQASDWGVGERGVAVAENYRLDRPDAIFIGTTIGQLREIGAILLHDSIAFYGPGLTVIHPPGWENRPLPYSPLSPEQVLRDVPRMPEGTSPLEAGSHSISDGRIPLSRLPNDSRGTFTAIWRGPSESLPPYPTSPYSQILVVEAQRSDEPTFCGFLTRDRDGKWWIVNEGRNLSVVRGKRNINRGTNPDDNVIGTLEDGDLIQIGSTQFRFDAERGLLDLQPNQRAPQPEVLLYVPPIADRPNASTIENDLTAVRAQLAEDIRAFGQTRNLSRQIPSLTEELQAKFERGSFVYLDPIRPGIYTLEEPPFDVPNSTRVPQETYAAYLAWRSSHGFADSENASRESEHLRHLVAYGQSNGFEISIADNAAVFVSPLQALYIESLLSVLPEILFRNPYFRGITLGVGARNERSFYDPADGQVRITDTRLRGSRRRLLATILHEIGHSTGMQYSNPDQIGGHGDETIPQSTREQMKAAFDIVQGSGETYIVNWIRDRERHHQYISGTFWEFIAEMHVTYVLDGEGLRRHIASIRDQSHRDAYQFIYNEFRDRIFGGVEYGPNGPLTPVNPPTSGPAPSSASPASEGPVGGASPLAPLIAGALVAFAPLPDFPVHAPVPPEAERTGPPMGLVFGGLGSQGQGILIPRDGSVHDAIPGVSIRFNRERNRYEFKEGDAGWKKLEIGQRIGNGHFVFTELRGMIADPHQAVPDLSAQIRYQLATEGVRHHIESLFQRGRALNETDGRNLSLFFTESLDRAVTSYDSGNPVRTQGGLLAGETKIFAFADPRTGALHDRFCDDSPPSAEPRRLEHLRWTVERNPADGNHYWWSERSAGFAQAAGMEGVPEGAVVVPFVLDRASGRIHVERDRLAGLGLSGEAVQRIENIDGIVVRPGGASFQPMRAYQVTEEARAVLRGAAAEIATLPPEARDFFVRLAEYVEYSISGNQTRQPRAALTPPIEGILSVLMAVQAGDWVGTLRTLAALSDRIYIYPQGTPRVGIMGMVPLRMHPSYPPAIAHLIGLVSRGVQDGSITRIGREELQGLAQNLRRQIRRNPTLRQRLRDRGVPDATNLLSALRYLLEHPQYLPVDLAAEGEVDLARTDGTEDHFIQLVITEIYRNVEDRGPVHQLLAEFGRDISGNRNPFPQTRALFDRLHEHRLVYNFNKNRPAALLATLIYSSSILERIREDGELARLYDTALRELAGSVPIGIPSVPVSPFMERELRRLLDRPRIAEMIDEMVRRGNADQPIREAAPPPQGNGTVMRMYDVQIRGGRSMSQQGIPTSNRFSFNPTRPHEGQNVGEYWLYAMGGVGSANGEDRAGRLGRLYFAVKPQFAEAFWEQLSHTLEEATAGNHPFQAKIAREEERFRSGDAAVLYFRAGDQEYFYHEAVRLVEAHPDWFRPEEEEVRPVFAARIRGTDGNWVRGLSFGQDPVNDEESFNSLRAQALQNAIRSERALRRLGFELTPEDRMRLIAAELERVGVDPLHPAFNQSAGQGGTGLFRFLYRMSDQLNGLTP